MSTEQERVERARHWTIYSEGASLYAWNGFTRKRIALYPVPEGGTWRDSLHPQTQGFGAKNPWMLAIEQFERLIGPYYPSRPAVYHD